MLHNNYKLTKNEKEMNVFIEILFHNLLYTRIYFHTYFLSFVRFFMVNAKANTPLWKKNSYLMICNQLIFLNEKKRIYNYIYILYQEYCFICDCAMVEH